MVDVCGLILDVKIFIVCVISCLLIEFWFVLVVKVIMFMRSFLRIIFLILLYCNDVI